jgi:hypothetical protein
MPTPDPSASLTAYQAWTVAAAEHGEVLAQGLGGVVAIFGIAILALLAILAVNVYRP